MQAAAAPAAVDVGEQVGASDITSSHACVLIRAPVIDSSMRRRLKTALVSEFECMANFTSSSLLADLTAALCGGCGAQYCHAQQ